MSYQNKVDLHEAYYGPPLPPPPRVYYIPRRQGNTQDGCGCCLVNCLCDCGYYLLRCICKIIFTILIILGLLILVICLILYPHGLKFHVNSANLTTFEFIPNTTHNLNYNLAVNFTAHNPNKRIGIYYDEIQADAVYYGNRLKSVEIMRFYQGFENTALIGPVVFKGQNVVVLDRDEKAEFEKEGGDGIYEIVVKLHMKVRFKVLWFKFGAWKIKVKCDLGVPLVGKSLNKFEETMCHYFYF